MNDDDNKDRSRELDDSELDPVAGGVGETPPPDEDGSEPEVPNDPDTPPHGEDDPIHEPPPTT